MRTSNAPAQRSASVWAHQAAHPAAHHLPITRGVSTTSSASPQRSASVWALRRSAARTPAPCRCRPDWRRVRPTHAHRRCRGCRRARPRSRALRPPPACCCRGRPRARPPPACRRASAPGGASATPSRAPPLRRRHRAVRTRGCATPSMVLLLLLLRRRYHYRRRRAVRARGCEATCSLSAKYFAATCLPSATGLGWVSGVGVSGG